LREDGARCGDLLGLFSSLEHFRRDLNGQQECRSILRVAEGYILGLDLFSEIAFFLINPTQYDFELAHAAPESRGEWLEQLLQAEIRSGRFAWALRQSTPTCFRLPTDSGQPGPWVVFQTMSVARRRLGMFCGILRHERRPSQEITFSLLSILLGGASDALAEARNSMELRGQILAANQSLHQALEENEVLARLPRESPSPVLRLSKTGQVLYSNQPGERILTALGWRVGDIVSGKWMEILETSFRTGERAEFEAVYERRFYSFIIAPFPEAGYANFYGTDITERKRAEAEREKLILDLQDALAKVKTLSGLVPICAWCKKIRDDQGFWKQVEVFIQGHSDAVFTHGVCPECMTSFVKKAKTPGPGKGSPSPTPAEEEPAAAS
jgi:PAS domain-containing protein